MRPGCVLFAVFAAPILAQGATHTVNVGPGFSYSPASLTIERGDTVHWVWVGGHHNVESGVGGAHDGRFRSGDPTMVAGTTFDVTFDEAFLAAHPAPSNSYPYYCAVHQLAGMAGTVIVHVPTPGDTDGDGDVDLADFESFLGCVTGPDVPLAVGGVQHQVNVGPGFSFIPDDLTIQTGDSVRWVWQGGHHNVESGVGGVHDGNFRSGDPTMAPGTTFTRVFDAAFLAAHPMPGNQYPYYCAAHVSFGMAATVTVEGDPCPLLDSDGDADVDRADFAVFQTHFSGD